MGISEINVSSHCAVMESFDGTEIVGHLPFRELRVALHQLAEGVQLLLRDVDGLVHNQPRGRLPASRVRGGAIVGHVVVRAGKKTCEG